MSDWTEGLVRRWSRHAIQVARSVAVVSEGESRSRGTLHTGAPSAAIVVGGFRRKPARRATRTEGATDTNQARAMAASRRKRARGAPKSVPRAPLPGDLLVIRRLH